MRGTLKQKKREEVPGEVEIPVDFLLVLEPDKVAVPEPETQEAELVTEPATEMEQAVVPPQNQPTSSHSRPSRVTRKPVKFGDYECYPCNRAGEHGSGNQFNLPGWRNDSK